MGSKITVVQTPQNTDCKQLDKKLYLILYVFMFSDFYIRSIPLIAAMAMISEKWSLSTGSRSVLGMLLFGPLLIFEFLMNRWIRIPSHQGTLFILKTFAVSVFSSFYTMLCTLDILKTDSFYAQSVRFQKYVIEHAVRCILSVVFAIISISLSSEFFVLAAMGVFVVFFAVNMWTIWKMYQYDSKSTETAMSVEVAVSPTSPSDIESVELQTTEIAVK